MKVALLVLLVCFLALASASPTSHPPPHTKSTSTHKPHTKSTSTHKPHTKSTSTHKPHTHPPTPTTPRPLQKLVNTLREMHLKSLEIAEKFLNIKAGVHKIVGLGDGALYDVHDPIWTA